MKFPGKFSVRGKLIYMALSTTFAALLVALIAMTLYDLRSFQHTWVDDLTTQAEIIASVSAPALAFDDPKAAQENLSLLRIRPHILAAAIYTGNGRLFATYVQPQSAGAALPAAPGPTGYRVEGGELVVTHRVVENKEEIGTVYLRASYPLLERLQNYLVILALVLGASLLVAVVVASRLQALITAPIHAVAGIARDVMQKRDYSLRAPKTSDDEIGVLVDSFNGMLEEIGRRSRALMESNRHLESEMAVRKSVEQALVEADRRKDEFLATLAHELRNPLAPLSAGLDILELKAGDAAAGKRARDIMTRQLKQLVRLVDDLLDVSRITTGKLTIQKNRLVLQDAINAALETAGPLIEAYRHTLLVSMPPVPITLEGDATRLSQVITNLLNNSAKYTNRGGHIELTVRTEAEQAVIRVKDNGIGIAAGMMPRVFDMFAQADHSVERVNAGLGVGLTLARRLIELHGGMLSAHSEGLGQGSEFTIHLPISAAGGTKQQEAGAEDEMLIEPCRILLADDNADFANTMAELLRSLGHSVQVAHDGLEALDAAQRFEPEFAFLDIGMPKLSGYELARRLRTSAFGQALVLVAVTGWGQDKDRRLVQEAGFDRHIVKPAGLAQFIAVLGRRRLAG